MYVISDKPHIILIGKERKKHYKKSCRSMIINAYNKTLKFGYENSEETTTLLQQNQ